MEISVTDDPGDNTDRVCDVSYMMCTKDHFVLFFKAIAIVK